jgi:hypothetical protein
MEGRQWRRNREVEGQLEDSVRQGGGNQQGYEVRRELAKAMRCGVGERRMTGG